MGRGGGGRTRAKGGTPCRRITINILRKAHSHHAMLRTPLTSHDPITPYVPVPWSLGTPLLALAQMPVPEVQDPI